MLPTIFKQNWILNRAKQEAQQFYDEAKRQVERLEAALPEARKRLKTAEDAVERLKKV